MSIHKETNSYVAKIGGLAVRGLDRAEVIQIALQLFASQLSYQ